MSENISGFNLIVRCIADKSFPVGFDVKEFADDTDPFDLPSLKIASTAMGLNGHQIFWSSANPIQQILAVIPGSDSDKNLSILFENNRPGSGKAFVNDEITMTCIYPNGSTVTFSKGVMTDGIPSFPIASAGRKKTKVYNFSFENYTITNN